MLEQKIFSLESRFENFEKVNSQFAKVKVYVLYTGRNRNKTDISKDVVEKAMYSLKNIPVVGEWKEENDNFGGHGGKLEISDDGMEWIETTKPYGVVPSDTEIGWETVREKDGITENQYLTCTAYMWYKRYPEIEKILNDGANQSMEVSVSQYHLDENGYAVFDEMEFSALCILGKDSNPKMNVEPCFEGAKITNYSFDKDTFKQEFMEMVQELKFSLQNQSSTSEVDDIQNIEEGGNSEVEKQFEEVVESVEENEEAVETAFEAEVVEEVIQEEEIVQEESEPEPTEFELLTLKYNELQAEYNNLQSKFNEVSSDNAKLQADNESLLEFKLKKENAAKEEVFAKFEGLTEEDIADIRASISEYTLDTLEEKLFAIWGKKRMEMEKGKTFSKKTDKKDKLVFSIVDGHKEEDQNAPIYADIVNKYKK